MRALRILMFVLLSWPVFAADADPPLTPRERKMLERIDTLEQRLAMVESRLTATAPAAAESAKPSQAPSAVVATAAPEFGGFLADTTFNMTLDGYYGYNFNRPVGRINLLRAYDVMSNSFSLNQAAIVIERAPDPGAGRRFGVRLDLQYGQATETLQGSGVNELRPQVYRPVFQAYGTYVLPVGSGLTVDFGKWASALGVENNYTKDQMNYSRSYLFNFLPFYHFGFRSSYTVTPWLNVNYWLVNGVQQSEDFNSNKSQAVLLAFKPAKTLTWNVNYYTGVEDRDTVPALNPGIPVLPTQPGLSHLLLHVPGHRLNIFDTYATWNVGSKMTLAAEADYVTHRADVASAHVSATAAYARYQFTPKFALTGRGEYLADRGGLFSGTTQALKEATLTADYLFADGFLMRTEWRRDFSNRPFFLTDSADILKREQNTATLGLVWWFGRKQGSW
jgi:Putative beta-barrel porin-2, OmpL-like. bbp2